MNQKKCISLLVVKMIFGFALCGQASANIAARDVANQAWLDRMSILVGSEAGQSETIKAEICPLAAGIAKQIVQEKNTKVACRTFSVSEFYQTPPTRENYRHLDKEHPINILIWADIAGDWHVYAVNSTLLDSSDVRQAEWRIAATEKAEAREALVKLLINIFSYYQNLRGIKEFALVNGLEESRLVKRLDGGAYVRVNDGAKISFNEAYSLYLSENQRTKHYLAATLEIGLLLGLGTHWYISHQALNSVDWGFSPEATVAQRIKTDDNYAGINIAHSRAGAGYYLASRLAGLGPIESFLFGFTASSIWEYAVENKEVISINDQIVTPVGGAVLGEVIYQIGNRVVSKLSQLSNRASINSYGKNGFIDRLRQDFAHFVKQDLRQTGLDFEMPGTLELGMATYKSTAPGSQDSQVRYYLDAEGYNIPMMNSPGTAQQHLVTDSNYYRLWVEATKDPTSIDTLNLIAETAMSGYYVKRIGEDEQGTPFGYSFLVAPAAGMDMVVNKTATNDYEDMVVNVNVLGSTLHILGQAKGVHFRIVMSVFGDFAMVQSYAFQSYSRQNDVTGAPAILRDNGYYYAGGLTGAIRTSVSYGPFEVGAGISRDQFHSAFTDHYRDQKQITFNPTLRDEQVRADVYGKVSLVKTLNLKCGMTMRNRASSINNYALPEAKAERFQYCSMTYSFL